MYVLFWLHGLRARHRLWVGWMWAPADTLPMAAIDGNQLIPPPPSKVLASTKELLLQCFVIQQSFWYRLLNLIYATQYKKKQIKCLSSKKFILYTFSHFHIIIAYMFRKVSALNFNLTKLNTLHTTISLQYLDTIWQPHLHLLKRTQLIFFGGRGWSKKKV